VQLHAVAPSGSPSNCQATEPHKQVPSIEKKYGQPVEHWIKLLQKQKDKKHMEVVSWLKGLIDA
jgi:hypothetical protein